MMKIETILTLAALGAAAALLWPKAKAAPAAASGGVFTGPMFGGSAGSMWTPELQSYIRPQLPIFNAGGFF